MSEEDKKEEEKKTVSQAVAKARQIPGKIRTQVIRRACCGGR
jgi:hypothetical protein